MPARPRLGVFLLTDRLKTSQREQERERELAHVIPALLCSDETKHGTPGTCYPVIL